MSRGKKGSNPSPDKYKSIKIKEYVYEEIIDLRNALLRIGSDNWPENVKHLSKDAPANVSDVVSMGCSLLRAEINKIRAKRVR